MIEQQSLEDAEAYIRKTIEETGEYSFFVKPPSVTEPAVRTQMENLLYTFRMDGLDIPDVTIRTKCNNKIRRFLVTLRGPKEQLLQLATHIVSLESRKRGS